MVRREQAIAPRLSLGDELLGEFERYTQASLARLTRLARRVSAYRRNGNTPPDYLLKALKALDRAEGARAE